MRDYFMEDFLDNIEKYKILITYQTPPTRILPTCKPNISHGNKSSQ